MNLRILGNGQIWDVKGILPTAWQKTFEDLFSGRALAQLAQEFNRQSPKGKKVFSQFKEKGEITGLSVTKALLSDSQQAKKAAKLLLERLAQNAAAGVETLTKGRGFKPSWSNQERSFWSNLDIIIIGGGVSEGVTGKVLVKLIKRYLLQKGLLDLKVYRARFPGKEAGFLGGLINIRKLICNEAKRRKLKQLAGIGIDLGREEIGIGLLAIDAKAGSIILKQGKQPWLFQRSVKTLCPRHLKRFLDSRKDYTRSERALGVRFRRLILERIVNLIIQARTKAQEFALESSRHIAVAVPGCTSEGYIINSTDYLPFFRKQDGFNFAKALENSLAKRSITGYHIYIINDGIAAGTANVYFDFSKAKKEKFAFLGVGSGLGGCVGLIR